MATLQQKHRKKVQVVPRNLIKIIITLLVLGGAVYFLTKHWDTVKASFQAAMGAHISWVVIALLLMCVTFFVAAAVYKVLAFHSVKYLQMVLIEWAVNVVNRFVPLGLGGLGMHGIFLYKRGHTGAEATVVVSVNNALGIVANLLLLVVVLAVQPSTLQGFIKYPRTVDWRLILVMLLILSIVFAIPFVRVQLVQFIRNLVQSIRKVKLHKLLLGLCFAALLTTTYTLILYATSRSLDVHLGILQIFIVFSFGMLASTATPTPGGLVGAEAGLFAGFTAYGVDAAVAGAAVLLYRLITYWLPLVPSAFALYVARQRRLL